MKKIKQSHLIAASPAEVWRALTDPKLIAEWSGADAKFVLKVGAEYALWDGSFCGKIVEVAPNKKLVQTWQPDYWETEDSVVTFTLTPVGGKTRVDLLHTNVEASDYAGTREGWELYYLGAIKQMLEERAPNKKPVSAKLAKKTKAAKKPVAKKSTSIKSAQKKNSKTKSRR